MEDNHPSSRPLSPQPSTQGSHSPHGKPLTMQLFSAWERSDFRKLRSPYFVPRLCLLNVTRLEFVKSIPQPTDFVMIVVRMQGGLINQRNLKSDKIVKPADSDIIDTPLDISFSLQYSHNVQAEEANLLQVMIVRRKKRTRRLQIICTAFIPLEDVVQNILHKKIILYGANQKGKLTPVCKIEVAVSSVLIADEFERHLQDDAADFREDLNFLSDEMEEEEEEIDGEEDHDKSERFKKMLQPLTNAKQPGRIKSKVQSLLRLRRPKMESPGPGKEPTLPTPSPPLHAKEDRPSLVSPRESSQHLTKMDDEEFEEELESPNESDFLEAFSDDSSSDDSELENNPSLDNLVMQDRLFRIQQDH